MEFYCKDMWTMREERRKRERENISRNLSPVSLIVDLKGCLDFRQLWLNQQHYHSIAILSTFLPSLSIYFESCFCLLDSFQIIDQFLKLKKMHPIDLDGFYYPTFGQDFSYLSRQQALPRLQIRSPWGRCLSVPLSGSHMGRVSCSRIQPAMVAFLVKHRSNTKLTSY